MLITTTGVVLREKQLGDNDKFIDVLTQDLGLIEICVKGVKKITSQNSSATQLFAYGKLCVSKRGERYYLNSSQEINPFYKIRLDVAKFALASYFTEVLRFTSTSEESEPAVLRLLLNTFHFLSDGDKSLALLKSIFELRLMAEIGIMPDIIGCHHCMVYDNSSMFFLFKEGVLLCKDCFLESNLLDYLEMDRSLTHTLRYILLKDFEDLWKFKVTDKLQKKLSYLSENYLMTHIERNFKTLDFYKSIL